MRVVFNNAVLCVVDYPALRALEVLDRRSGTGAFMREDVAQVFRRDLEGFLSREHESAEDYDELLARYSGLFYSPTVVH